MDTYQGIRNWLAFINKGKKENILGSSNRVILSVHFSLNNKLFTTVRKHSFFLLTGAYSTNEVHVTAALSSQFNLKQ